MRIARQASGLSQEGEPLIPFRSPLCMRGDGDSPFSFQDWNPSDPLPVYEDHVKGVKISQPFSAGAMIRSAVPERANESFHFPFHQAFEEQSVVKVHVPSTLRMIEAGDACDPGEKPTIDKFNESAIAEVVSLPVGPKVVRTDQLLSDGSDGNEPSRRDLPSTIHDPTAGESEFRIYLEFPGQDRPRLAYQVYTSMPVRLLYRTIANGILECEDYQIRIFVDGACLLHLGTVTDRYFPDCSDIPTVLLYPDCTAFVRIRVHDQLGEQGDISPAEPKFSFPPAMVREGKDLNPVACDLIPRRRVSTRVPIERNLNPPAIPRRPIGDRWYYAPVLPADGLQGSSDVTDEAKPDALMLMSMPEAVPEIFMLGPVGTDRPPGPLSKQDSRMMLRRFITEGRYQRRKFRTALNRDWESNVAPAFDQENDNPDLILVDEQIAFEDFMSQRLLAQYDQDFEMKKESFLDDLRCSTLDVDLFPNAVSPNSADTSVDDLRLRRTEALWAGLCRVYFGEIEDPDGSGDREPSAKKPRNRQTVADFKRDVMETQLRIRHLSPRVPDDLNTPYSPPSRRPDGDDDDVPPSNRPVVPLPPADDVDDAMTEQSLQV